LIACQITSFHDPLQKPEAVPVAREQRKLAAILAANVVDYPRLMGLTRAARWHHSTPFADKEPDLLAY